MGYQTKPNTPGNIIVARQGHPRIVCDTHIHNGQPCIKKKNVPVSKVLKLVRRGYSISAVGLLLKLSKTDCKAAVKFAIERVEKAGIQ